MNNLEEKKIGKEKGITLVALVVTIVVLLILAGITITMLFGENGIIKKAQDAADATKNAQDDTVNGLANLESAMNAALGENGGDTVVEIATLKTDFAKTNTKAKDAQGNIVTVPKGFKVVEGTAGEEISVQNGVVVEDSAGNQFVWIPVGNVNIIKDDGSKGSVNIELARYDFTTDASTVEGSRVIKQLAKDYATNTSFTPIGRSYQVTEYATRKNAGGLALEGRSGLNAIAEDLAGFIDSVIGNETKGIKANGGYYLARYEASKDETDNTKPASKYDKAIWGNITQINAAKACRKMYLDDKDAKGNAVGVKCDLVNSYAWDTAIIYIEKMKTANNNYANTNQGGDDPTSKLNTGKHNDSVCNIHDMSGNAYEWSTEYSDYLGNRDAEPCVTRGGDCDSSNGYTAVRYKSLVTVQRHLP